MRSTLLFILFSSYLIAAPLPLYFKGNEKIASRDLYDTLGLRLPYAVEVWSDHPLLESTTVSQSVIALVSYYRSKGYFETKISTQEDNTSITLIIQENEPITVADIKVNSIIDVDSAVMLKLGDLFNQETFSESKQK